MCAASQVSAIFGAEVVWRATRLAILYERKLCRLTDCSTELARASTAGCQNSSRLYSVFCGLAL